MMARIYKPCRVKSSQSGGVIIVMLLLIIISLVLAALVVDLLVLERAQRMLQRAADAASLAGAVQLEATHNGASGGANSCRWINGSESGWKLSKLAALKLLREHELYRDDGPNRLGQPDLIPPNTSIPTALDDPLYSWEVFDFDNITVRIERGIYEYEPPEIVPPPGGSPACRTNGARTFKSVEISSPDIAEVPSGCPRCNALPGSCISCNLLNATVTCPCGAALTTLPVYEIANAVRVTLITKRLPTFFARLSVMSGIGLDFFANVSASAIGAAD
jgi:hypothetical protein